MATVSSSRPLNTISGRVGCRSCSRLTISMPPASPSDRSARTIWKSCSSRRPEPRSRLSAQTHSKVNTLASRRSSVVSRAPPALSSIRRMRSTPAAAVSTLFNTGCDPPIDLERGELRIAVRQRHHRQPEALDGAHDGDELLEIDRLGDVAIGVQLVALDDVVLGFRGGEHHHRNDAQPRIGFHLAQHLAAVLARQVEIEKDQVGRRGVGMNALALEERQRFNAVLGVMEIVADLAFAQCLLRQARVAGIVFHQQDFDVTRIAHHTLSVLEAAGRVKLNLLPWPGVDSIQMRPPWCSITFLTMARPMPVPGYLLRSCRRWKIRNTRSRYAFSMPMPLSSIRKRQNPPSGAAEMRMSGVSPSRRNLIALPIKFWNSWPTWVRSPRISGSAPTSILAPLSDIAPCRLASTVFKASAARKFSGLPPWRPMRE